MRVAYVVPYLRGRGGWATAAEGAIRALSARIDPVLVVAQADAREAKRLFPEMPLFLVPEIQPLAATALAILPRLLRTRRRIGSMPPLGVEMVHALEAFPAGWVGKWLAQRENLPLLLTAHGTYAVVWKGSPWLSPAYERVLQSASAICPISNGTALRMKAHFPKATEGKTMEVVLQGTSIPGHVLAGESGGHRFPDPPVILSVGNLKERKGYHVSLQAFAKLQGEYPAAKYWIVGAGLGGTYHQMLERTARRQGIRNVEFLGTVERGDLDHLYAESSLFLLASQEHGYHFEGFGLVFLEAGAHGLPVVGTRTGGIPEAVQDGETGFLVDSQDVSGMAEAMIRLVRDPGLAHRLGQNGRKRAETLSWERYAEQQCAVYARVLARTTSS